MKPDFITDTDWKILKEKYPQNINEILKKLESHYPVQYVIGNVEFLNTIINVDERVLIPRFETELLVEKTIKRIKALNIQNPRIIDLGTGSGCIAISLKKNLPCFVTAIDISEQAIELAKENALKNQVEIEYKIENMINTNLEGYDVIISNPPYISYDEEIDDMVKNNEPSLALYASNDGVYFYDKILSECAKYLNDRFLIAFEIGYTQGDRIIKLAYKYLSEDVNVKVEKDYSDKDRFVFIWN